MKLPDKILAGAEFLFLSAGLRSVTMDDLASHLGMSKKTIYRIYKNKNELIAALVEISLGQVRKKIQRSIHEPADVFEKLNRLVKHLLSIYSKSGMAIRYDLKKYYPETWCHILNFKQEILKTMEGLLQKGQEQGLIRGNIDPGIQSLILLNMITFGVNFPALNEPMDRSSFQDHLFSSLNFSICSGAGFEMLENANRKSSIRGPLE